MYIAAIDYSLSTKSVDIYVSGCKGPHCSGCHNSEIWEFDIGEIYGPKVFEKIRNRVLDFPDLVSRIMIFGGEPLDQNTDEFIGMLNDLNIMGLPIWLFTRYQFEEVSNEILDQIDYLKTGRYIEKLKSGDNIQFGISLASSNQNIYNVQEMRTDDYSKDKKITRPKQR